MVHANMTKASRLISCVQLRLYQIDWIHNYCQSLESTCNYYTYKTIHYHESSYLSCIFCLLHVYFPIIPFTMYTVCNMSINIILFASETSYKYNTNWNSMFCSKSCTCKHVFVVTFGYYVSPSNEGIHIVLVWFVLLPPLSLLLSEASLDHNFFVFPDRSMICGMSVHDHQAVCLVL